MGHILSEVFPFLASVFSHWQIWLSGGGIGGFIVILVGAVERLWGKSLSKKQYVYLFLISFFLCSCFLSWVDKDDAFRLSEASRQNELTSYRSDVGSLHHNYDQLEALCNYRQGVGDTLAKQNRDQQNTINGCQAQALKLLQPVAFAYDAMALDSSTEKGGKKTTWLIVTNKPQTPVSFTVTCTDPILSLDVSIVSQQTLQRSSAYSEKKWLFQISSPAWTPHAPIVVRTITAGESTLSCEFGAKGTTLK